MMFEPKDVLAVHYMISESPKRLTGIRVCFKDGTSKAFHGAELAAALAVVEIAFPPRPDSTVDFGSAVGEGLAFPLSIMMAFSNVVVKRIDRSVYKKNR